MLSTFQVDTAWKVRSLDGRRAGGKSSSQVTISLRVNFLKKTILRKTVRLAVAHRPIHIIMLVLSKVSSYHRELTPRTVPD